MARGFLTGMFWAAILSIFGLWVLSQVGEMMALVSTPPEEVSDEAPKGAEMTDNVTDAAPETPDSDEVITTEALQDAMPEPEGGDTDAEPMVETAAEAAPEPAEQVAELPEQPVEPGNGAAAVEAVESSDPAEPDQPESPLTPTAETQPQEQPQLDSLAAQVAEAIEGMRSTEEGESTPNVAQVDEETVAELAEPDAPVTPIDEDPPIVDFSNPVVIEPDTDPVQVSEPEVSMGTTSGVSDGTATEAAPMTPDANSLAVVTPDAGPEADLVPAIIPQGALEEEPAPEAVAEPEPEVVAEPQVVAEPEPADTEVAVVEPAPEATTPTETEPSQQAGDSESLLKPIDGITSNAPNVRLNQLPTIGGSDEGVAEDAAAEPEAAPIDPDAPAIRQFASEFQNADNRPVMAILLRLDPDTTELGEPMPFPVSYIVDASSETADAQMRMVRDHGNEVIALAPLPEGAGPVDVEVAFLTYLSRVPEAVAIMDTRSAEFQAGRIVASQISEALASSGHGMITFNRGLNSGMQIAERDGVPAALVFREFDNDGQNVAAIKRFLDQAAFRAGQQTGVILVGHYRPDTITALLEWGIGNRANTVALAPISAALTQQ